ncbi:unnamed protein product [Pseudo-nitzschia multistriata]|uniref:RWD domain-containing protein n=1 Tax=Pseudo-nitzschia multistriata TaxID=183589 RepID=A0A448Z133_9STRA|nr:unnamed protein product [Pseudo-nitzschia multistriata]
MTALSTAIRTIHDLKPNHFFSEQPGPLPSPQGRRRGQGQFHHYQSPQSTERSHRVMGSDSDNDPNLLGDDAEKDASNGRKREKTRSLSPCPSFLPFDVEDKKCAVYVGDIPFNGRNRCRICFGNGDRSIDRGSIQDCDNDTVDSNIASDDDILVSSDRSNPKNKDGACACETELKAYIRGRIFAAYKTPIRYIGIRSCRFFALPARSTSSSTSTEKNDAEDDEDTTKPCDTNSNLHRRSDRRLRIAACIEFENPRLAEYSLGLKYTTFSFRSHPTVRAALKFRPWAIESRLSQQLTPRMPPKHQNSKEQQLAPPKNVLPRPISSPPHRRNLVCDIDCNSSDEQSPSSSISFSPSPPTSSCLVLITNIPSDVTCDELAAFLVERMNRAFRGKPSPTILRLAIRKSKAMDADRSDPATDRNDQSRPIRNHACVEFQDARAAFRATTLKHRRWHAKPQECETENNVGNGFGAGGCSGTKGSDKTRDSARAPCLGIEIWDPTKHDVNDFFIGNESSIPEAINTDDGTEDDISESSNLVAEKDEKSDGVRTASELTENEIEPKLKTLFEELKEDGFLVCKHASINQKLDHLFAIPGSGKKASMCQGYAFRGRICRAYRRSLGIDNDNNTRGSASSNHSCPYVHIDSLEDLEDPLDVLAILYFVHNNDDINFVPGHGWTPQEYLQQQQFKLSALPPSQHQQPTQSKSMEEVVEKLQNDLSEVRTQLAITQQELLKSENANEYLLEKQSKAALIEPSNTSSKQEVQEKDTIRSLQDEIARLKIHLDEKDQNLKASERDAAEIRRECFALIEQSRNSTKQVANKHISDDNLKSDIMKLKEELQQTRSDIQKLDQTRYFNPNSHVGHVWAQGKMDNFIQTSVPALMELAGGTQNEQQQQHAMYHSLNNSLSSLTRDGPDESKTTESVKSVALQAEIAAVQSLYGREAVVTSSGSSTTVTRYIILPVLNSQAGDITVTLIITLPKGYPSQGVVEIDANALPHSFPRIKECISSLLLVCQWEAEACTGSPAVIRIMKKVEQWVQNDWEILQRKLTSMGHGMNEETRKTFFHSM